MKAFIKVYLVTAALLLSFSLPVSAQNKKGTNNKKTVITAPQKNLGKKVPSTKVTYKKPTRKVVSVRTVPNKTVVKYRNQNYYYANNRFYTQSRGRYIVIAPKVGFRIKTLPPNYQRVRYNNFNYYNFQGTFYVQVDNEYEVVDPEIGTLVYELPEDYEKVTIDGETYYEYGNILYEKVQVDGVRAYEVVGIITME